MHPPQTPGDGVARLLVKGSGKLKRRQCFILTQGNDKIGADIFAFNLPAVATCPGMSAACDHCYARRARWRFPGVRDALRRNWEAARDPSFAARLTREIKGRNVRVLRVHASGDSFSESYVRAWARVARRCPGMTIYGYTRSWRLPYLRGPLERLAALPNVRLWYSADLDTGMPRDVPPAVRVAWLQTDVGAAVPAGVGLVFRTHPLRRRPARRLALALVCPDENGVSGGTNCSACGLCWRPPGVRPAVRHP
jgi:hypothetical protein